MNGKGLTRKKGETKNYGNRTGKGLTDKDCKSGVKVVQWWGDDERARFR